MGVSDPSVDVAILAVPHLPRALVFFAGRRKPVPTLWCWVIPAAAISPPPTGFAGHQAPVAPIFAGLEPVTRDVYTIRGRCGAR